MSRKVNQTARSVSWGDRLLIVLLIVVLVTSMAFAATITQSAGAYQPAAQVHDTVYGYGGGGCSGFGTFCSDVSWNS